MNSAARILCASFACFMALQPAAATAVDPAQPVLDPAGNPAPQPVTPEGIASSIVSSMTRQTTCPDGYEKVMRRPGVFSCARDFVDPQ